MVPDEVRAMKRTGHRDPVTPELRLELFARDQGCIAPRIDPEAGECSGRLTVEHVKSQPRLGVRAPSTLAHLVTLCEGHTENGMKAGRVWNLRHRDELRAYLASFEESAA